MAHLGEGFMTLTWETTRNKTSVPNYLLYQTWYNHGGEVLDFFSSAGCNLSVSTTATWRIQEELLLWFLPLCKIQGISWISRSKFFPSVLLECLTPFSISLFLRYFFWVLFNHRKGVLPDGQKIWLLILISRQNRNGHSHTFLVDTHVSWLRLFWIDLSWLFHILDEWSWIIYLKICMP